MAKLSCLHEKNEMKTKQKKGEKSESNQLNDQNQKQSKNRWTQNETLSESILIINGMDTEFIENNHEMDTD